MAKVGTISIDLVAHTGKLLAPIKKAQAAITGLAAKARSVGGAFMRFAAPVTAMVSGVMSIYFAISKLKKAFEEIGNLADESARLGIPAEQLAGLQYAAVQAGMTVESLGTALQYMMRQGRSVKDLGRIADELDRIADPVRRMQRAIALFGRGGSGMLNMLAGGSAALQEQIARAEKLGLVVNSIDASRVEAAGDAWANIGLAVDGVARRIMVELSPYIIKAADDFVNWGTEGVGAAGKVNVGMQAVVQAISYVANAVDFLRTVWAGAQVGVTLFVAMAMDVFAQWYSGMEIIIEKVANAGIWMWKQWSLGLQETLGWIYQQLADFASWMDNLLPESVRTGIGGAAQEFAANWASTVAGMREEFETGSWRVNVDIGGQGMRDYADNLLEGAEAAVAEFEAFTRRTPLADRWKQWEAEARAAAVPVAKLKGGELEPTGPAPSVGALERGSAAAMSAIVATQKTLNLEQQQLEAQRSMRTLLERIEGNTRQQLAPAGLA